MAYYVICFILCHFHINDRAFEGYLLRLVLCVYYYCIYYY